MRSLTRFIPGEEIDAVSHWSFGSVDTEGLKAAAERAQEQQVHDLLREEALRQEGYALGFAQGKAHAIVEEQHKFNEFVRSEGQAAAQRFAALFAAADSQLNSLEQGLSQGVLDIALALARQVLRQELSVNPNVLQPVVREAVGLLVADAKAATVRMHPLDVEVFQDTLGSEFAAVSLSLVADSTVHQGGCVVSSAGTVVDGRLETRWRRAVATLGLDSAWEEPA